MAIEFELIKSLALEHGLDLVGAVSIEQLRPVLAAESRHLAQWQAAGYAGEMDYMNREAELFAEPERLLPGVRSVISFAVPYADPRGGVDPTCPRGFGRVARYAQWRDYHLVIKKILRRLMAALEAGAGGKLGWRAFSDAVPFLERAAGAASGLGFRGKNGLVIRPGAGSYFFLAEVLLDLDVVIPDGLPGASMPLNKTAGKSGCGTCARCQTGCPTGAFVAPHRLDARRCISYLTIEKKSGFSAEERAMVGDWIFGCDRCQEVCPFNHSGVEITPVAEFGSSRGAGALVDLKSILETASDGQFTARFAGTPLMRPGRIGMIRNALAVAANQRCVEVLPAMIEVFRRESSQMIKTEALAALRCLKPFADRSGRAIISQIDVINPDALRFDDLRPL